MNFQPGTSLAHVIGDQQSVLSQTESDKQSSDDLEGLKYKTELCRNYSIYGFCSYSTRCQFAHGFEELRCRTHHPKYQTELCRNYLSGFCKYGSRCQFLHHSNLSPTVVTYLLTNLSNF